MNIFVTDKCPIRSAQNLDNIRINKMCVESAQMLSTAIWYYKYSENWPLDLFRKGLKEQKEYYKNLYKQETGLMIPSYVNHPCTIWTRKTRTNYYWLLDHFKELNRQYTNIYGKTHGCEKYTKVLEQNADEVPRGKLTYFTNCTPFKEETNIVKAYRNLMEQKWKNDKRTPKWGNNFEFPGW